VFEDTLLPRLTTSEALARQLRAGIQRGEFPPGSRLRQADVARRFGVSTTPVREAFALLQAEGLLQIDPHRGAFVFSPSEKDVSEYYEIREVLEDLAVSLAVERITDEVLRELGVMHQEMLKTEDPATWAGINDRFHLRIYQAADHPRLSGIILNLREASSAYLQMCLSAGGRRIAADHEHASILEALRAGNATEARAATREHLRRTFEAVITFIGDPEETERIHAEVNARPASRAAVVASLAADD
jgi:DNA-binding GntR family transcriptional regulator